MKEEVTLPSAAETCIYVLTEADGLTVRYVGQANSPVCRLYGHIKTAMSQRFSLTGAQQWIRSTVNAGGHPRMFIVEKVPRSEAFAAERKWMYYYRERGQADLNYSGGNLKNDRAQLEAYET